MSIETFWDDTLEDVVYFRFTSPWSWDEYIRVTTQQIADERIKHISRYDVIGDFLGSNGLPSGSGITHVAAMFRLAPASLALTVVVTNSSLIRMMVNIFVKIYPQRTKTFVAVATLEEAYEQIRQARQKP
jgi:hypothetical protein